MYIAKSFKKFSLFPNFSLYGLFQARKTDVAMNLFDLWLRAELPGSLQLAERLHFKELLCLFLRIISSICAFRSIWAMMKHKGMRKRVLRQNKWRNCGQKAASQSNGEILEHYVSLKSSFHIAFFQVLLYCLI